MSYSPITVATVESHRLWLIWTDPEIHTQSWKLPYGKRLQFAMKNGHRNC